MYIYSVLLWKRYLSPDYSDLFCPRRAGWWCDYNSMHTHVYRKKSPKKGEKGETKKKKELYTARSSPRNNSYESKASPAGASVFRWITVIRSACALAPGKNIFGVGLCVNVEWEGRDMRGDSTFARV